MIQSKVLLTIPVEGFEPFDALAAIVNLRAALEPGSWLMSLGSRLDGVMPEQLDRFVFRGNQHMKEFAFSYPPRINELLMSHLNLPITFEWEDGTLLMFVFDPQDGTNWTALVNAAVDHVRETGRTDAQNCAYGIEMRRLRMMEHMESGDSEESTEISLSATRWTLAASIFGLVATVVGRGFMPELSTWVLDEVALCGSAILVITSWACLPYAKQ